MRLLHIGNPDNRRCTLFAQACHTQGLPAPRVLAWEALLADPQCLVPALQSCDGLRIDSSGESASVYNALVHRGGGTTYSADEYNRGRIGAGPAWYRGWSHTLHHIHTLVTEYAPSLPLMSHPSEIALMFDKLRCQQHLAQADLPIPRLLGPATSAAQIFDLMERAGINRVFVKPRHSSSASGVIALQRSRHRILATTSVQLKSGHLYNSLRLQHYRRQEDVTTLLDLLGTEHLLVEAWFPKLTLHQRALDLRVLVIAGQPAHIVARQSTSPITNLHLGNSRGDLDAVRSALPAATWDRILSTCATAAASFPRSHYLAVDLMIHINGEHLAIAEINAFGDLLPNLHHQGRTTHEQELHLWQAR